MAQPDDEGTSYCTILAANYLPKALALADSLQEHHPGTSLEVLLIDARDDDDLPPPHPGVEYLTNAALGLDPRRVLELLAGYSLVEFATAVKPLLLQRLLRSARRAIYLDPDTYVTSPMVELAGALAASAGGIVLTPHYLDPFPPEERTSEGHLLLVGVHNLGFCAVDDRTVPFLEWWWGHLEHECLVDPLSGLFVDQKWVDVGFQLFEASTLRHRGYNVGVANIHERPIDRDDGGYFVKTNGDRLRLFHFHSFDTSAPEELSTRFGTPSGHHRQAHPALDALCRRYAEVLIEHERRLGPPPPYRFGADTRGRPIPMLTRRVLRDHLADGRDVPSPFVVAEADGWDRWRRAARREIARDLAGDVAKSFRLVLPDQYRKLRGRYPGAVRALRSRFLSGGGLWSDSVDNTRRVGD